ncbi:putative reverse transcriptase domain-containing protein [Tanacetum coccineum]
MRFSFDVESDSKAPEDAPQSPDQAPLSPAHAPVYSEYLAPSDDDLEPAEAQPLPASVSPIVLSPDYLADFEPVEENLEEDPGEDHEEDPKEDPSEEEDELSTPTDSPSARLYIDLPSEVKEDETPLSPAIDAFIDSWVAAPAPPLPPPSLLSPLSSPLPMIPSPPLLLPPPIRRDIILEADMPPQKRARFDALFHRFEIGESSAAVAARQPGSALTRGTEFGFVTALEEVNERVTDLATKHEPLYRSHAIDCICGLQDEIRVLQQQSTRTSMSQEALEELISQRVADALATYDTNRSNCDDSHDLGSGRRRTVYTTREMVPDESDKVEKYTGGLPDSIHGSVMASKPKTLQEAIELTRSFMDQKLLTYVARKTENKRKMDNNSRNNHAQKPPYKRQNMARAYVAGFGEKRESTTAVNTQRTPGAVQKTGTCFECGSKRHYKRDCSKLKNQGRGNATGIVKLVERLML